MSFTGRYSTGGAYNYTGKSASCDLEADPVKCRANKRIQMIKMVGVLVSIFLLIIFIAIMWIRKIRNQTRK